LLDSIYGQVMRVRRRRYERQPQRQRHLSRPVISVGNLSMGGTGKSPVVAAIAQWLVDAGQRPAILSRGYARRDAVDGVVVVSDGGEIRSTLDRSGDEPLMLARQVPRAIVCVSPDRHLAGLLAEQQLNATVHILDDGFQHLDLARDLDILVTTVGEIPNGKVIPSGRLREPIDAAARAHVLVVSDATAGAAAAEAWALGISQSCGAVRTLGDPIRVNEPKGSLPQQQNEPKGSLLQQNDPKGLLPQGIAGGLPQEALSCGNEPLGSLSALAVAGIAHPDRFFAALKQAGHNVVDSIAFRDHHPYSPADIAAIAARASKVGANAVLTTEKDAVRFEAHLRAPRYGGQAVANELAFYRVPLHVDFDPAGALFESVNAVLK
jgi:tetraacyldisaccharide 4'-kinase